jgi:AcrR family transcriptional regulator
VTARQLPAIPIGNSDRLLRSDAARNRERIIVAARSGFSKRGTELSLTEVARLAGVGPATLYRRFPNKDELIRAVFAHAVVEYMGTVVPQAVNEQDAWSGLVTLLRGLVEGARNIDHLHDAVHDLRPIAEDIHHEIREATAELLAKAKHTKQVRADVSADDFVWLTSVLLTTACERKSNAESIDHHLTIILDGLKAQ